MMLFVDDVREVGDVYFNPQDAIIARSYESVLSLIERMGLSQFFNTFTFISLDNDMGEGRMEGTHFMQALMRLVLLNGGFEGQLKHIVFNVHSQNPVAAKELRAKILDLKKWAEENG